MTSLDNLFADFQTAHSSGDRDTMFAILQRVPDLEMDGFTQRLDAAGFGPPALDDVDGDAFTDSLRRAGIGHADATSLSVLMTGSFAEFVRDRMHARGIDADSVLRRIDEGEAGSDTIDEGDETLVRAWIAAVLDGDDEPDVELPNDAEVLLARALGSTEHTVIAIKERG